MHTPVTVISRQPVRRRIGRAFGAEPADLEVTPQQLAALKADPLLVVIDRPAAEPEKDKKPKP